MPLVKENKERKNVRYSKDDFAYQSLPFSFERDPVDLFFHQRGGGYTNEKIWRKRYGMFDSCTQNGL